MQLRLKTGQAIAAMAATNTLGEVDKLGERRVPMALARPRRRIRKALELERFEEHRTVQAMLVAEYDDATRGDGRAEGVEAAKLGRELMRIYTVERDDATWLAGLLDSADPHIQVADDAVDAHDAIELQCAQALVEEAG